MQLEAVEPAPAAFAALGQPGQHFVPGNSAIMAHSNRQTVDEWNAGGWALARLQISTEWQQQSQRNPFHKAGVAGQTGKLRPFARQHRTEVEVLEGAIVRSMKEDQNGHDLAQAQAGGTRVVPFTVARRYERRGHGLEALAKIIDV